MRFRKQKKDQLDRPRQRSAQSLPARDKVFSYRANRSEHSESTNRSMDRLQAERRGPRLPVFLRRARSLTVLALILVFLVLTLRLTGPVRVMPTGTKDGQVFLRDQSMYNQAAQELFSPILNKNKLTINTSGISEKMRQEFPELRTVTVTLPFFKSQPTMYIQPAIPAVILVAHGGMYVLDSSGRALITGNEVRKLQDIKVPIVNDQSGLSVSLGKVALPRNSVAFITQFVGQLRAKGVVVTSLTLPAGNEQLELKLQGSGYTVTCNMRGNAREQAGAFLAVKGLLDSQHKAPVEYIDVRVPGRAYYK